MIDRLRRTFLATSPFLVFGAVKEPPEMKCGNCFWFRALDRKKAKEMGMTENIQFGNCHFNPPAVAGFGRTDVGKFCSHFKQKEGES